MGLLVLESTLEERSFTWVVGSFDAWDMLCPLLGMSQLLNENEIPSFLAKRRLTLLLPLLFGLD